MVHHQSLSQGARAARAEDCRLQSKLSPGQLPGKGPQGNLVGWVGRGLREAGGGAAAFTGQCGFRISQAGGGPSTGEMVPSTGGQGVGLTEGPRWLSLQPLPGRHTAQSFPGCLLSLPSRCPSTNTQGECLRGSESMHGPFKGTCGFLTWRLESPLIFRS